MPEETPKNCLSCGKDDNKTGKPCPTRKGCHFPNYDNWVPVFSPSVGVDHAYRIEAFTFKNGEFVVTVENDLSGRSELVEVTAADIIGLLKK